MGEASANCFAGDYRRSSISRSSGFNKSHILVTPATWHRIADVMWRGHTFQEACKELGLDEGAIERRMNMKVKRYLVDVSILANCREDYLGAVHTNHKG